MNEKNTNNEILLSNIRELCKKNNITVAYLEKVKGMGAGTISKWNKASPTFDNIVSVAQYFKVSIDQLSGYSVNDDEIVRPGEDTLKVIGYLKNRTISNGDDHVFWKDYKESREVDMLISELPCMKLEKGDMSRLYYACDGEAFFLLEVIYSLNDCYDYETQLRLYIVPKANRLLPVLECSSKTALQELYIAVVKQLEIIEIQREAEEEVRIQRDRILKEYSSQNE